MTIHAGRVLDGRGDVLTDVTLVIEGTRIVRVERRAAGASPPTYDLAGLTLLWARGGSHRGRRRS